MDIGTIVAIVVCSVNLAALVFVARQVKLTQESVKMTQRSIEISELPKAHDVFMVQHYLEKWKSELEQIIKDERYIRAQIKAADATIGEKYGLTRSKGLINSNVYESLPDWLRIVWISAAQYYYDCKLRTSFLSDDAFNTERKLRLLSSIVELARAHVKGIKEMLSYMEKMIPEWYVNCPVSEKEGRFMDR